MTPNSPPLPLPVSTLSSHLSSLLRLLLNLPPPTTQPNFTGFLPSSSPSFFIRKQRARIFDTTYFYMRYSCKKENETKKTKDLLY